MNDQTTIAEQAGFATIDGLTVSSAADESGQDRMMKFVLSGDPESIDAALDGAGWAAPFQSGNSIAQLPIPEAGIDKWQNVESSSDDATVNGRKLYRRAVRGTQDGTTKLHVWAFTT